MRTQTYLDDLSLAMSKAAHRDHIAVWCHGIGARPPDDLRSRARDQQRGFPDYFLPGMLTAEDVFGHSAPNLYARLTDMKAGTDALLGGRERRGYDRRSITGRCP